MIKHIFGQKKLTTAEVADILARLEKTVVVQPTGFRCSSCSKKHEDGASLVWISDGILKGVSLKALFQTERGNRWNGSSSGWCLPCVTDLFERGLAGVSLEEIRSLYQVPPPPPPPETVSEEEQQARQEQMIVYRKQRRDAEARKHELFRALSSRLLSFDELEEVGRHGSHINIQTCQSYNAKEKALELSNALAQQSLLQMAASREAKG